MGLVLLLFGLLRLDQTGHRRITHQPFLMGFGMQFCFGSSCGVEFGAPGKLVPLLRRL